MGINESCLGLSNEEDEISKTVCMSGWDWSRSTKQNWLALSEGMGVIGHNLVDSTFLLNY